MTESKVYLNGARVEISGGIASGKTTLARLLSGRGLNAVLEDFTQNPFIEDFYQEPRSHAFEAEVTFLLQHYHQTKTALLGNRWTVCDFSLALDLAYTDVTLTGTQMEAFAGVYKEVAQSLGQANLIIYLRCSPSEELLRIKNRGRPFETGITLNYLQALEEALERRIQIASGVTEILTIDSEHLDFYGDLATQNDIAAGILGKLASLQP